MTDDQEKGVSSESGNQDDLSGLLQDAVSGDADADSPAVAASNGVASDQGEDFKVVNKSDADEGDAEAAMLKMLEDLPAANSRVSADDINFSSASKAEFQQLQQPVAGSESRNIELLMDVDLPIAIELGRTKMSIADILGLGPGSVVELNKLAGEPVDLLVNQRVVARGEVVVVDENFGLRITQLMTPEERLRALAEE
ncbi:MAG: flagellar motor switch protein FliN [candidate division Zixibacteria bacterium]|nr:flagellar motor switch protein FliN [candidate division Zixibacteria bacterium]